MNFGFSCFKKLFCCIPQVYSLGSSVSGSLGHIELGQEGFGRNDPPLSGSHFPRIERQSDWVSVCAGGSASYGILSDGSLWAWGLAPRGDGSHRDAGVNAELTSRYPVFVDAGPWMKVSSSPSHTVGIKADGTMWQWGDVLPSEGSGAVVRARLSASVEAATARYEGMYSADPTAARVMNVTPAGYVFVPQTNTYETTWEEDTSRLGSGAEAAFEMCYPLWRPGAGTSAAGPWHSATVVNGGAGYGAPPRVEISDGETVIKAPDPEMTYSVTGVTVSNGGNGYTTAPTVTVSGSLHEGGTAASAYVSKMGCIVTGATIISGGSGYISPPDVFLNGEFRSDIDALIQDGQVVGIQLTTNTIRVNEPDASLAFSGGGGTGAEATANTILNHVVEITLTSGGSKYRSVPRVVFTAAAGAGAAATVALSGSVTRFNPPTYYSGPTPTFSSPPFVTVTGQCTTPAILSFVSKGYVKSVTITNGGSQYTQSPDDYNLPSGSRRRIIVAFTRSPDDVFSGPENDAIFDCQLTPGPISSIIVESPGSGYSTELKGELKNFSANVFGQGSVVPAGSRLKAAGKIVESPAAGGTTTGWPYRPVLYVDWAMYQGPFLGTRAFPYAGTFDGCPYPKIDRDIAFKTASLAGRGAKAKAVISATGQVQSAYIVNGGEDYLEEPYCVVANSLIWPRQVGESDTWKDVAAGRAYDYVFNPKPFSVAINSSGELYWWGAGLTSNASLDSPPFLPSPVGSGLIANAPDGTDFWPDGIPYVGYQSPSPPDVAGRVAQTGAVYASPTQSTVKYVMSSVGYGYLSAPAGYELHGPSGCESVVITNAGNILSLTTAGELWNINSLTIEGGAAVGDTTNSARLANGLIQEAHYGAGGLYGAPPSTPAISETTYTTGDATKTEERNGADQLPNNERHFIESGGTGYTSPTAKLVNIKTHWRIIKRVETYEYDNSSVVMGFYGTYTVILRRTTFSESVDSSGDVTYESPYYGTEVIETAEGSIVSPGSFPAAVYSAPLSILPSVPPTTVDGTTSITQKNQFEQYSSVELPTGITSYRREAFVKYSGDLVIEDPTGTGASYVRRAEKVQHGGVGQSQVGIGKTWNFVTSANVGVLSGGALIRDAIKCIPFQEQQQGVVVTAASGGLIVRDDQTVWDVSGITGSSAYLGLRIPPVVVGDIELKIEDAGEGYTEPVVLRLTQQPAGVAKANTTLLASVVSAGVIHPGAGYNTPPTITIDGGAQATATIVGEVSEVTITNPGTGYRLPPRVVFSQPGFSAEGVAFLNSSGGVASVTVTSGGMYRSAPTVSFAPVPDLKEVTVQSGGSGYSSPPDVVFAGGLGGAGAVAKSVIDGKVTEVVVASGGGGYTTPPDVIFIPHYSDSRGKDAAGTAVLGANGKIASIQITSQGSMYQTSPSIRLVGGGGNGAAVYAKISGPVHSVELTSRGANYHEPPSVFFTGGGGAGAEATAVTEAAGTGGSGTCRINGELLFCTVTSSPDTYTETPSVTVSGGDNRIIADADLRLANGEITQAERDRIVEASQAKVQARICGAVTATVEDGGSVYAPSEVPKDGIIGPYFAIYGSDSQGRYSYRGVQPELWRERDGIEGSSYVPLSGYSGVNYHAYGPAAVDASGGISSVQIPPIKFTAPPLIKFQNTVAVRPRTRARLAGVAIRNDEPISPPFGFDALWFQRKCVSSTIFELRKKDSLFGGMPQQVIQGAEIASVYLNAVLAGNEIEPTDSYDLKSSVAQTYWRNIYSSIKFEVAPLVEIEAVVGSGKTAELVLDSSGELLSMSMSGQGAGYGSFTRCRIRGGRLKITPPSASAVTDGGRVVAVQLSSQGSGGYTRPPTVVIHGGGGSGASAEAILEKMPSGFWKVIHIEVLTGGAGYASAPTVSIVSENKQWSDEVNPIIGACVMKQDGLRFEHVELRKNSDDLWLSIFAIPRPTSKWLEWFFDSGYLDEVFLESSLTRDRLELSRLKRLPLSCTVVSSGKCERQASVAITRPAWSNVLDDGNSRSSRLESPRAPVAILVRDTTQ